MAQLEHIEAIEKRLWSAADQLRANSNHAANEYFMPVMGLIFLRHAHSRYLSVRDGIVANLPSRGGKTREVTKEDFSQKSAIFLRPEAQFDYLVGLPDSVDRAQALIAAMDSIEARLLEEFDEVAKPAVELGATLRMQNRRLAQARDLLLPRLMSGELEV